MLPISYAPISWAIGPCSSASAISSRRSGGDASDLIETSLARRSAGLAKLDPSIDDAGRITKRWGLRVNAQIRTVANA